MKPFFFSLISLPLALLGATSFWNPAAGDVLITEMMVHPAHVGMVEPTQWEFIELYNAGIRTESLGAWKFDRGIRFTFPSVEIAPGSHIVVAADKTAFAERYPHVSGPVYGNWEGHLSNSGESVRLVNALDEVIDEVRYADEGDWAQRRRDVDGGWIWTAPFDGDGPSLELIDLRMPNQYGQNWMSSAIPGGTPGEINSVHRETSAPILIGIAHEPPVPRPWDFVRVHVRPINVHGSHRLDLLYRRSSPNPGSFDEIPMRDEGTFGDAKAGDGIYSAEIPPQPDGEVVEFFVRASNDAGVRTWPAPSDDEGRQETNALYQVGGNDLSETQPHYRIIMTAEEHLRFRPENFPSSSNARMHATFIASNDGKTIVRYQASIRRRGNSSRSRDPRSFRISLPQDAAWEDTTELNLASQYSYLQTLGMHLFEAAGLPAPQARLVQLRLNGENDAHHENRFPVHYGSYAHIEPLGPEFIDRAFPADSAGNLYKKVSANGNRDRKRWGVHFETTPVYKEVPDWHRIDRWTKETNRGADDWSDLQDFVVTMNEAEGAAYYSEVTKRIDLNQWLRWFALMNLINNRETNLSNGIDDDYSMYHGLKDPRFQLLPHDLDTILGMGDTPTDPTATIFQMIDPRFGSGAAVIPQLERFMDHPTIRLGYFRQLADLLDTVLAPETFEPLVDQLLTHVPAELRERMKTFMRDRRAHVLGIIDAANRVELPLEQEDGLWITDDAEVDLSGEVSSLDTASVLVQGIPASYDRRDGRWMLSTLTLQPGVNHLVIQTFDDAGRPLDTQSVFVWRRGDVPTPLEVAVNDHLTLTASQSPYVVEGVARVAPGASLTIEPGVTLYFKGDAQLVIEGGFHALGEEHRRILLTIDPREIAGATWRGVVLRSVDTAECFWTTWHRAETPAGSLQLELSHAKLEGVGFSGSEELYIGGHASSMTLNGGHFEGNRGGHIRMDGGLSPAFPFLIEACRFGSIESDAPAVGIVSRPVTDRVVPQVRGNTFQGSAGTLIAVQGSVLLDGNHFARASTGVTLDNGRTTDRAVLTRNHFDGVVTAARCESAQALTFENNLVHRAATGLAIDEGTEGELYVGRNLFVAVSDPVLADTDVSERLHERHNLNLATAPATLSTEGLAAAFADQHVGPSIPSAPYWTRTPPAAIPNRTARFSVAGPGIIAYRYRLDGGAWTPFQPLASALESIKTSTLQLDNLVAGEHVLELEGRDLAGEVPHEVPLTFRWEVDMEAEPVVLNRILAVNRSLSVADRLPDLVELHNRSEIEVSLAGYRLSDDPAFPDKYVFPADSRLAAGSYLTLMAEEAPAEDRAAIWLGFSLDGEGETLTLRNADNRVADHVAFGSQAPDIMLGRLPASPDRWGPVISRLGEANETLPYTPAPFACINEAYAAAGLRFGADFVELYNGTSWPLLLNSAFLTDDFRNDPRRLPIAPLTILPASGYVVLSSESDSGGLGGTAPLTFGLDAGYEVLTLHDGARIIDQVFLQGVGTENSIGRLPDGGPTMTTLALPSPGMANRRVSPPPDEREVLIDWNAVWAFEESDVAPPADWHQLAFSDEGWRKGRGPLGREDDALPVDIQTPLALNPPTTHYFRHVFTLENVENLAVLSLSVMVDDGALFYLNGQELHRSRMEEAAHGSYANSGVGNASVEGPFERDAGLLRKGQNVLAASLHQDDNQSSDAVFAAFLTLARPPAEDPDGVNRRRLLESLRITELMYHPPDNQGAEWLELRNVGPHPLDLAGVRLVDGIAFTFPPLVLAPGEHILVVEDRAAFERRYGPGLPIAGEFAGRLDNAGEAIALALPWPDAARIQAFTYNNGWYPASDGAGMSLTIRDALRPPSTWVDSVAWSPGSLPGGTPGLPETPRIYAPLQGETILGDAYSVTIRATNDPVRWAAEGLPTGLSVDEISGVISGRPLEYGSFAVTLSATNATGTRFSAFRLDVAASGPLAAYRWDPIDPSVPVETPIAVGLSAIDSVGRLVRDHEGSVDLLAASFEDTDSPVLITEIFDAGPDGLEIQNLKDTPVRTAGWRLLLNIGTSADPGSVHGLDGSEGTVWHFPNELEPGAILLLTDQAGGGDSYIGFNIQWDSFPPGEQSAGGQRGWAVILDHEHQPVDAVVWGYGQDDLETAFIDQPEWSLWLADLWLGDGVPHKGEAGRSLARVSPIDTDDANGWEWADATPGNPNEPLSVPGIRLSEVASTPDRASAFENGVWTGPVTFLELRSNVRLRALDPVTGLQIWSEAFAIVPLRAPALPQPLAAAAVQGLPFHYRIPFEDHVVEYTATQLPVGLRLDAFAGEIAGRPEEAGSFSVHLTGSNALGTAEGVLVVNVQADRDGDGMADDWEEANGLDATLTDDGWTDLDGDGAANRDEFLAGTDPRDSSSRFIVVLATAEESPGSLELRWTSVPGRRYQLWEGRSVGSRLRWVPLLEQPWLATEPETRLLLEPDRRSPSSARLLRIETSWSGP